VLEVGSFCGVSAIAWGRALERIGVQNYMIYCADLWYHSGATRYGPETLEIPRTRNAFNHEIFKFNVSKSIGPSRVTEVIGDSRISLRALRDGFFDAIYIDGYHGHDVVREDIVNAFRLCKPQGIVCGDDYDCSPEMLAAIPGEAMQWDHYVVLPTEVGVHPGVVLAVNELFGPPRPYGGFWAFTKVAERAAAPFVDCVVPIDVTVFPRRIPDFIPPEVRPRFEAHFAGPEGFLIGHPMTAGRPSGRERATG